MIRTKPWRSDILFPSSLFVFAGLGLYASLKEENKEGKNIVSKVLLAQRIIISWNPNYHSSEAICEIMLGLRRLFQHYFIAFANAVVVWWDYYPRARRGWKRKSFVIAGKSSLFFSFLWRGLTAVTFSSSSHPRSALGDINMALAERN